MRAELQREVDRLKAIMATKSVEFEPVAGATDKEIAQAEEETRIKLDEDLKDFYRFTNGSNRQTWFAVISDQLEPHMFLSLHDALHSWSPHDIEDDDPYEGEGTSDERIQPNLLGYSLWFPFTDFGGGNAIAMFDADPTSKGKYGQIIVYQHDPDAIYYVAESFLAFFKKSNDLFLERDEAKEFFE